MKMNFIKKLICQLCCIVLLLAIANIVRADVNLFFGSAFGDPNPVAPDGLITYSFAIINSGDETANDVEYRALLPFEVDFEAFTDNSDFDMCEVTAALEVICDLEELDPLVFIDLVYQVRVFDGVFSGAVVSLTSVLSSNVSDSFPVNNQVTLVTGVAVRCGDSITNAPAEQCDDGNSNSGDGCSATCQDEFCGDGIVQNGLGETCDDGNDSPGDGCNESCMSERCGDGVVQTGGFFQEQCDDGNNEDNDGCDGRCLAETCGDKVVQGDLGETCDDGNSESGDGCNAVCQSEKCGDGEVQVEGVFVEQCDDGNAESGDGCSPLCQDEQEMEVVGAGGEIEGFSGDLGGGGCSLGDHGQGRRMALGYWLTLYLAIFGIGVHRSRLLN